MSTTTIITTHFNPLSSPHPSSKPTTSLAFTITCGPRDNRGPIVRGRTLSTEAIQAVQSLKRTLRNPASLPALLSSSLPRLLRADLVAAISELLRQDHPLLSLHLLPLLRSDPSPGPTLLSLYANVISCLARNGYEAELGFFVEEVVGEVEREGGIKGEDLRGPARLLKSLVAARRGEEVKEVYGLMKRGGCVPNEYLFKFLSRGLRRLGDEKGAEEVERDFDEWDAGGAWGDAEMEEETMAAV